MGMDKMFSVIFIIYLTDNIKMMSKCSFVGKSSFGQLFPSIHVYTILNVWEC